MLQHITLPQATLLGLGTRLPRDWTRGTFEGKTAFQKVQDRHVGPEERAREQKGRGWLECLTVERGVLGIHSKTNDTNSTV